MKKLITFVIVIFSVTNLYAQDKSIDSLKLLLTKATTDTGRVNLLNDIGSRYGYGYGMRIDDSSRKYAQQALALSKQIGYNEGEIKAGLVMVRYFIFSGNYSEAMKTSLQVKKQIEQFRDSAEMVNLTWLSIALHLHIGNYKTALKYGKEMQQLVSSGIYKDSAKIKLYRLQTDLLLGNSYDGLNLPDSALHYWLLCYKNSLEYRNYGMAAVATINIADLYRSQGKDSLAFSFYRKCISYGGKSGAIDKAAGAKVGIALLYHKKGERDSTFYYTRQALQDVNQTDVPNVKIPAYNLLSDLYQQSQQYDSAYKYLKMHNTLQDSIYNQQKITQTQNLSFNETMQEQQLNQAKKEAQQQYATKIKLYILAAVILIFLIIAFFLLRNIRNKRKANILLSKQKEKVESTLSELKSTQQQLIQSEKMASLGELTAGIAHEIQNPLNFVNNFSDVNTELIDEMEQEIDKGNIDEVKEIAKGIKENEQKINHHGKRADAIVKGMLQHSRVTTGQKELTDINALADEYLRLSYHGLRAKDKSFNATMETDFDDTIGKINIIPQDMGRVLLNLYNNAFYAVQQKQKELSKEVTPFEKVSPLYEPTVSVATKKKSDDKIQIIVKDNGNGIPQNIINKIFQPFFTTKPTGEGTGLGLSLSYDIIKAHGGTLKVETKEGGFTEFQIELPET